MNRRRRKVVWISLIPISFIWRLIITGEQALFNLEIKKKSGSSIDPDIHHSKVKIMLVIECGVQ